MEILEIDAWLWAGSMQQTHISVQ